MSEFNLDESLQHDIDFHTPLERVNFEAGMLLGVDATRAEQTYHRLRVNRHNYWHHGAGTLVGFAVKLEPQTHSDNTNDVSLRLIVSPGIGIDGLGRDVMSYEPYCVNLRDWFTAQLDSPEGNLLLQDGLNEDGDALDLLITMRYHACATGLQPVLARKINAGTDPVQPSRARDSVMLEIIPSPLPPEKADYTRAGLALQDVNPATDFTETERDYLATMNDAERNLHRLQGRLLYGIPNHNRALEIDGDIAELSRTLLAHIRVPLRAAQSSTISPIINPEVIEVNNLVRPFINTADHLAWLSRQELTP